MKKNKTGQEQLPAPFNVAKSVQKFFHFAVHHLTSFDALPKMQLLTYVSCFLMPLFHFQLSPQTIKFWIRIRIISKN